MKNLFVGLLMISSAAFATDVNINGVYFSPAEGDSMTGDYSPAFLTVVQDGVIADFDIINGATLVEKVKYTIKGNIITVREEKTDVQIFDCNGEEVSIGGDDAFESSATVVKDAKGLTSTVNFGGEEFSIFVRNATSEETFSILNLPRCTLKK